MVHTLKNYKNYKDFYIYVELAKENHSTMNLMTTSPQVIPFGVSLYLFFFWGGVPFFLIQSLIMWSRIQGVFLPQPPKYWDYKHALLYQTFQAYYNLEVHEYAN